MEFQRCPWTGPRPVLPPWMSRESQRIRSPGWASTNTCQQTSFPILQNTDFIVWPVLHFCKAFIAGKFNNADNNLIIKVSPQLRRNVSLGPGKSLQLQSDEGDFSYERNCLDQSMIFPARAMFWSKYDFAYESDVLDQTMIFPTRAMFWIKLGSSPVHVGLG